jgi:hypothetical protein
MRPGNVAAGQDESTIVQLDEVAAPLCARLGADHYEGGRGGDLFTLAGPDVLERQGCQAGLAVAVRNSGAEPDFDFGVAFSWVMRQPDMLAASDSPRTSTVTRVANLARCRAP